MLKPYNQKLLIKIPHCELLNETICTPNTWNIYIHICEDFSIPKTIPKYPTHGKKKLIRILFEHLVDIF